MALDIKGSKHSARIVNICVVGLSGIDQDRTLYGVGKSCLCNRFVRPSEDKYSKDHSSVFSTSDFGGSVINNDHFLYWGAVAKTLEDGSQVIFRLIEQTEFIDDSSFLPLTRGGQLAPYPKRCTTTKLNSPGKLMYISRDQVAVQGDYEQVGVPDGKLTVDGFLCVYDVGISLAEKPDHVTSQEEMLSGVLSGVTKTKKPVVVVATKCDESDKNLLDQAYKFVHTKKLSTPLVETSAQENINVELGFSLLAQMVEGRKGFRSKITHYQDAYVLHKEIVLKSYEKYLSLVKSVATDLNSLMTWPNFRQAQQTNDEFSRYVFLCGTAQARRVFNQQVSKIKQHFEDKKLNEYLGRLPDALDELLPSLQAIENSDWKWEQCQHSIKNHKFFSKWFRILPKGVSWNDREEILADTDSRIPFDILQLARARACFDRHVKKLMESAKKVRMKTEFRKLLELTPQIRPGTSWSDAYQWLSNEESYKFLDESERKVIFERYLQDRTLIAKLDFQELLFESAQRFMKLSQNVRPSDSEMKEIYNYLEKDERYKNLENVGNARDILLFNHIALMQSPNRCLSGPEKCMDRLMQGVVEIMGHRPMFNPYENDLFLDAEDEQIGILVFGRDGLAQELENKIKLQSSSSDSLEYIVDGQIYALDLRVITDCDIYATDIQSAIQQFRPQGYLAIFSDQSSLQYLDKCLQRVAECDGPTDNFMNLPVVILLASDSDNDQEIHYLRREGNELAERRKCLFVDYPFTLSTVEGRIHESQVPDAIRGIVDVIKRRSRTPSTPTLVTDSTPDLRIQLCAMCGDQYPVELILGPLLHHQSCYCNSDQPDTILLETYVGTVKRTVSITLVSYHRAYSLKNMLFHGFILVYSATRKASLETLSAFAMNLPQIPIQFLAVTGSASGASVVFHNDTAITLLAGGTNLANKLSAKFQTTSPQFQHQTGAFAAFFTTAYEKKDSTERLVRGFKRRRQDPLPEVPKQFQPSDLIPNGKVADDIAYEAVQTNDKLAFDISPYAELPNASKQFIKSESDSLPSSPNRGPIPIESFSRGSRSRSSTVDSRESIIDDQENNSFFFVPHDAQGLYAQVFKRGKQRDSMTASDMDEDAEIVWKENVAYEPGLCLRSFGMPTQTSTTASERQYATIPSASRGQKINNHDKYNTIGDTGKRGWEEPEYASIDQVRSSIIGNKKMTPVNGRAGDGYEPGDSLSSLSSKSKDSLGSQGDVSDAHRLKLREKIDFFNDKIHESSPIQSPSTARKEGSSTPFWIPHDTMWVLGGRTSGEEDPADSPKAPLATKEDDNDFVKLRQMVKAKLSVRSPDADAGDELSDPNDAEITPSRPSPNQPQQDLAPEHGSRVRSKSGSRLLDESTRLMKIIRKKMTPNPSPVNSDNESGSESSLKQPTKVTRKSRRGTRRGRSPPASKPPPPPDDNSSVLLDSKSNSLPIRSSSEKKDFPMYFSLDSSNRRSAKNLRSGKVPAVVVDNAEDKKNNTQERKKDKKDARLSRDDLDIPSDHHEASDEEVASPKKEPPKKEKRKSRSKSLRLPRDKPKGDKNKTKKEKELLLQAERWNKKKKKNKLAKSNYFGKKISDIVEDGRIVPSFVDKCLRHVELVGLEVEGIYRVSGRKEDIELVLSKFEDDKDLNFQELGVSVHAITGALKQFFTLLPSPLIPVEHYGDILNIMVIPEGNSRINQLKDLVSKFPPSHVEIFKALMMHLNMVTEKSQKNKMDVRNLATVLFPTLMRPETVGTLSSILEWSLSQNRSLKARSDVQCVLGGHLILMCLETFLLSKLPASIQAIPIDEEQSNVDWDSSSLRLMKINKQSLANHGDTFRQL